MQSLMWELFLVGIALEVTVVDARLFVVLI